MLDDFVLSLLVLNANVSGTHCMSAVMNVGMRANYGFIFYITLFKDFSVYGAK